MSVLDAQRPDILGPQGEAALAALAGARPLLAFDFDGTLAPIADHPDEVRVAPPVAACLEALASRVPLAIVTGRAVADVQERLGFKPGYIVGSHGAESAVTGHAQRWRAALDGVRERLARQAGALAQAGVGVEDKGLSIALHYRLAPDQREAQHAIRNFLAGAGPQVHVFGGKMVYNLVATGAPDKADAVRALVAHLGCDTALFVGDDVNDESVFCRAPAHWVTVKMGRDDRLSHARFLLEGQARLLPFLQRLLRVLPGRG